MSERRCGYGDGWPLIIPCELPEGHLGNHEWHHEVAASAGADPERRTDFDDPVLYDPAGMRPQCTYIVHWHSCRLDAGHPGKHSPGAQSGPSLGEHRCLTYSPSLDVERLAKAICGTLDPQPTYGFVDDDCRARARIVAAAYEELGEAPEASEVGER